MTHSFYPPQRLLMGPGPSDIHPRVLQALSRPTVGHLDPFFIELMDDIKLLLQYVFKTQNALTLPISAPGSAGMEACFVNLIEPGDAVLICQNGVFGGRMLENAKRAGAEVILITEPWGQAIDPEKVETALKKNPRIKALAFVHAETSTGVLSDAKTLCALAAAHDCLSIVDAVTSLAGSELDVDGWGIDAIYSGSQKCLSCTPGLSPVSFSERATKIITSRTHPVQSWFLDMQLVMGYWAGSTKRAYHHTAPVNALYALHEALSLVKEEGLEAAWARHQQGHNALRAGIETLGLSFAVATEVRLPQLNAITVPKGIDEARVRQQLLNQFDIEIGAGLGELAGKVWRIGLMGHSCDEKHVYLCLSALASTLKQQGLNLDGTEAVAAAARVFKSA